MCFKLWERNCYVELSFSDDSDEWCSYCQRCIVKNVQVKWLTCLMTKLSRLSRRVYYFVSPFQSVTRSPGRLLSPLLANKDSTISFTPVIRHFVRKFTFSFTPFSVYTSVLLLILTVINDYSLDISQLNFDDFPLSTRVERLPNAFLSVDMWDEVERTIISSPPLSLRLQMKVRTHPPASECLSVQFVNHFTTRLSSVNCEKLQRTALLLSRR